MLTGHQPYLQMEQRGPGPHRLTDLQFVLLPGETGRTLVVGWQHFDVDCSDGRPGERGRALTHRNVGRERRMNDGNVPLLFEPQLRSYLMMQMALGIM